MFPGLMHHSLMHIIPN